MVVVCALAATIAAAARGLDELVEGESLSMTSAVVAVPRKLTPVVSVVLDAIALHNNHK